MKKLEKELEKLNNSLRGIGNSIFQMEQNPVIQEYLALRKKEEEFLARKKRLEDERNTRLNENCTHIFVREAGLKNEVENQVCIKCGLGASRASTRGHLYTNIECDITIARRIYQKIVADHPNISNMEAAYMLKSALKSLEDSEEQKQR